MRPFQEHELDALLGDFAGDFDRGALLDELTTVNPSDGNRYWLDLDAEDVNRALSRHDAAR